MGDHTISVDTSQSPTVLTYSDNFNVAVPFIDRHIEEGRADKVVIRTNRDRQVTYGELAENVNRTGNVLLSQGIKPGERCLMMVKDCPEFFYVFWGAIKAGIIAVPINTLLRSKDYTFMIDDSASTGIVYSPEFAAEVEPALEAASNKPGCRIVVEGDGETLVSLMAEASADLDPAPATATDDCFWLYSSGTTGSPKGTVHSHRDIPVTCQYFDVDTLTGGTDDICFSAAKLFFAYGLGNGMNFPLWVGGSTVLFDGPPTPAATFEMIEKFKPTLYFGVPTLYAAQLQALAGDASPDLSSLRYCVSAGEALPGDIYHRWKEQVGVDILDGIGSTEALHIFIANRPGDIKPGTSGRIVAGYDARILDNDGNEVAVGESGQLLIRGDSTAKFYWNKPEKTAETMVDGWLNTGDTYFQDEDGYYHYCGRNDDMLKVGGIWTSPFEIEAKLVEHPKVLEAAVVGRADDENLIKPEAFVVVADGVDVSDNLSDELLNHCKDGLARYKYPRWFNYLDELPKTATGKIQRYKLRSD